MVWGYLSEFWDAITQEVVESGVYTIDWFQSLGNAVAGAIGGLFENLIHHLYDIFYIFNWLFDNLADLFLSIFSPLKWIFSFLKGFWISATAPPVEPEVVYQTAGQVKDIFEAVPYWQYFSMAIGIGLSILVLGFIFKRLANF